MVYDWVKKTAKLSLVLVLLIQRINSKTEEGKKKKKVILSLTESKCLLESLKFTPVIKHSLGYQNSCY